MTSSLLTVNKFITVKVFVVGIHYHAFLIKSMHEKGPLHTTPEEFEKPTTHRSFWICV